jgi:hypothetical protein
MLGMAAGLEAVEPDYGGADDAEVLLGNGRQGTPERVESVTVEAAGTCFEPSRVEKVWRANLGDMDDEIRVGADELTCRTCVVEVDVREKKVAHFADLEAVGTNSLVQCGEAARRPTIEERRPVIGIEEVGGDALGHTAMVEIDGCPHELHPGRDARQCGGEVGDEIPGRLDSD